MEKNIAISIIVPIYNMEKYLSRCVESLLNQTFQNIQIILVDDCSTDNSMDIERLYKKRYPEKIVLCQTAKNSKQGAARNLGLNYADGEYIMYVDSDDWLERNACECLINQALVTDADIVYGEYQEVREDGTIKSIKACVFEEQLQENYGLIMLNPHYPWGKIIRKKLICEHKLFFPEDTYFEDITIGPLYVYYANKIEFVKEVCYNYLQRETSVMHVMSAERVEQEISCAETFLKECKIRGIYDGHPEIVMGKFFVSACVFPYIHITNMSEQGELLIKQRIEGIIHQYRGEFLHNSYISVLVENYLIEELLPEYEDDIMVAKQLKEYLGDSGVMAVWGAGVKGKDFVGKYHEWMNIRYVIDRNENLHDEVFETGQKIVSIKEYLQQIDTIVVVNANYYYDIVKELSELGWKKQIINYEALIRTLLYNMDNQ